MRKERVAVLSKDGYPRRYVGEQTSKIAFPLGGMGAGMMALEGCGALSHFSFTHKPNVFNNQWIFSALSIKKGAGRLALVLEGPVPDWKIFGNPHNAGGQYGNQPLGFPRFSRVSFSAAFPFASLSLSAADMPLAVELTAWSPFTPPDPDPASLPVAALEYKFRNRTNRDVEAVYYFSAHNFLSGGEGPGTVRKLGDGFIFSSAPQPADPSERGWLCARVAAPRVFVNAAWFRGGWFDNKTLCWRDIEEGRCEDVPERREGSSGGGATIAAPFVIPKKGERTVTLRLCWYFPSSNLRVKSGGGKEEGEDCYRPWYAARFSGIEELHRFWEEKYAEYRRESELFRDCFVAARMPAAAKEAVAANLSILKSPTVLRQADGRLWCWEGCCDWEGCCYGSCTHVWNYAQAIAHLFPSLERTLRESEFLVSQDERGHQAFRTLLPIRLEQDHSRLAAADGQLGGIMKVYRDWRISGDSEWLRRLWPRVKQSLEYCIETWDPQRQGVLVEPHHNTYDIEFWGPDGMCSSIYLGALKAAALMAEALGEDAQQYRQLYERGKAFLETELFNGEYFEQRVQWQGLRAGDPTQLRSICGTNYSEEALELLRKEGPKYQYGTGCLSDGILGEWLAEVCGVGEVLDAEKVQKHLRAVYRHNFKPDLSRHANPQRSTFALGKEGGLLLCTWPRGGALSLPFPYSNEVWTGIEYQVAAHLIMQGMVKEGLELVKTCRARYDGRKRNPFDEYECGHWYGRALSSYALLQALGGVRYDAVRRVLRIAPAVAGDFSVFLCCASGFGLAGVRRGKPFVEVKRGTIEVGRVEYIPFSGAVGAPAKSLNKKKRRGHD